MNLEFDENYVQEMADLDEISKDIMAEQDMNVYDTKNIDTEITNRAHIICSDGEISSLED